MNIHARQYELSDGANAAAPQTLLLNKSESESENNYKHDEKNANRAECWLAGVTFWAWLWQPEEQSRRRSAHGPRDGRNRSVRVMALVS